MLRYGEEGQSEGRNCAIAMEFRTVGTRTWGTSIVLNCRRTTCGSKCAQKNPSTINLLQRAETLYVPCTVAMYVRQVIIMTPGYDSDRAKFFVVVNITGRSARATTIVFRKPKGDTGRE